MKNLKEEIVKNKSIISRSCSRNNHIFLSVFVAFLLLISTAVFSQANESFRPVENPTAINNKVSQSSANMQTLQADFVQEKHMDFLQMDIISKGKFWFRKKNQLRWQYTNPYAYTIVINNGKISIDDEGKESEFKVDGNKIFEQVNNIIVTAVSGNIMDDNQYETTVLENESYYKIILIPKNSDVQQVIKEMHLFLQKSTLQIEQVKMIEPTEDYTLISFKNQKINEPISPGTFILR